MLHNKDGGARVGDGEKFYLKKQIRMPLLFLRILRIAVFMLLQQSLMKILRLLPFTAKTEIRFINIILLVIM